MGESQQPTDGVDEILRDDGLLFLQKAYRGTEQAEERVRSTMKNRKAKMLISRVYRRCYPSQWLRVSNRRVVLFSFSGIAREGVKEKRSAAQNRWKNHLRIKGE